MPCGTAMATATRTLTLRAAPIRTRRPLTTVNKKLRLPWPLQGKQSLRAETVGFEPTRRGDRLAVFKTAALVHYATSPSGASSIYQTVPTAARTHLHPESRYRRQSLVTVFPVIVGYIDGLLIHVCAVSLERGLGSRIAFATGRRRFGFVATLPLVKLGVVDASGTLRDLRFGYFPPVHNLHGTSEATTR